MPFIYGITYIVTMFFNFEGLGCVIIMLVSSANKIGFDGSAILKIICID